MRAARGDFAALNEAARLLSCGQPDVPAMLGKALEERKQAQRSRQILLDTVAGYEAQELLRAVESGATRMVVRVFDDAESAYLRMVAARLAAQPGVQALLATRAGGHVVFAQSPGLAADMNALLREALHAAGGKGGGTRDFAQGSVPDASRVEMIVAAAATRLRGAASLG
jgi:alanyl-tRNA synthetase